MAHWFVNACPVVLMPCVERSRFSPLHCLCIFVQINGPYLCGSVSGFLIFSINLYHSANTPVGLISVAVL